jgi:hypothetical protein
MNIKLNVLTSLAFVSLSLNAVASDGGEGLSKKSAVQPKRELVQATPSDDDSDFLLALQMSLTEEQSNLNPIDAFPAVELRELSRVVWDAEDCLYGLNDKSMAADLKEMFRMKLLQHLKYMAGCEFVTHARAKLFPTDQSDVNFVARMSLCDKIKNIYEGLQFVGMTAEPEVATSKTSLSAEPKGVSSVLLKQEDIAALPMTYIPHVKPVVTLLGGPKAYDDFSDDAIYLDGLLAVCRSLQGFTLDCIKDVLLSTRGDIEEKLREIQTRYLTVRNATARQGVEITDYQRSLKGFEDCKRLIQSINQEYPGLFPRIYKKV